MTENIENAYSTAAKGIRDYNVKILEIARANTDCCFDFAQQMLEVKSPSEMMELWTAYARKQFEVLTEQTKELAEQTKELAALGQKLAIRSAKPVTGNVTKAFNKVAA